MRARASVSIFDRSKSLGRGLYSTERPEQVVFRALLGHDQWAPMRSNCHQGMGYGFI